MKILFLFALCVTLLSCKKEVQEKSFGTFQLRLTDSPADYEHLYLDIQQIQLNHSVLGWINVDLANPGVYDILALNNGVDTLLSSNSIEIGLVSQIRLILGGNNSLVKDGVTHNLTVQSGSTSGLKINVQQTITENSNIIRWIDVDAYRSIVQLGNGNYILKPVLRSYSADENGKIKGSIIPIDADPLIYAVSISGDTLTAIPETNGMFQFSGMNGTYDLHFVPFNTSYNGFSLLNQQVIGGQTLNLGAFSF